MEQKQMTIVLGVVRDGQGRYLLGKRNEPTSPAIHGKWNILGGKVEFNETPEETVVREIKEESGLDVKVIQLLPKVLTRYRQRTGDINLQVIELAYECEVVGGELSRDSLDPRVSEVKFINPTELKNYDLIEGEQEVFDLIS